MSAIRDYSGAIALAYQNFNKPLFSSGSVWQYCIVLKLMYDMEKWRSLVQHNCKTDLHW